MELWIRSQGKMKLVKVNYCYIREWQDHFAIEVETFDSALIVGEYKTKERALEVLDEIQQFINNEGCHFINHDAQSISLNTYKVYEMPEE